MLKIGFIVRDIETTKVDDFQNTLFFLCFDEKNFSLSGAWTQNPAHAYSVPFWAMFNVECN